MTAIADLSAVALAAAIRSRSVSPVEATQAVLARMDEQRHLNAFITICAEEALQAAGTAEEAVMRGDDLSPLHGVPFSVKDLLDTASIRTTMGSRLFEGNVPARDAVSVARAKQAGAILIGKTTTPEFGHVQSATSPLFGRTLNPLDHSVTPGASSSGAAVAAAAGMGPLAIGTDGGGSIRIPASCCGIVGFKPTLGAIPHLQLPDMFGANSYVGPMARTVADARLLFDAIAGAHSHDPYGQAAHLLHDAGRCDLKGTKIGWIVDGGAIVESETAAAVTKAVAKLEEGGASVEPVDLNLKAYEETFLVILRVGLAARAGPLIKGREKDVARSLVETIELGRQYSAVQLSEAVAERTRLFRAMQDLHERYDVLVSPTLTAPPLPIDVDPMGEIEIDGRPAGTIRGAWYPFTYAQNLTGHPAISIPCGMTGAGLPVGLQIAGRWYSDRSLLEFAERVEQLLGEMRPD